MCDKVNTDVIEENPKQSELNLGRREFLDKNIIKDIEVQLVLHGFMYHYVVFNKSSYNVYMEVISSKVPNRMIYPIPAASGGTFVSAGAFLTMKFSVVKMSADDP